MTNSHSIVTTANSASFPHAEKHFVEGFVCPCCGEGDELESGKTDNYGAEVFENVSCPKCGAQWRNEYRLHCIRHQETAEVVLKPSQPLAALQALAAASWLESDPCDSDELALAKQQALEAIAQALRPS